jgi:Fe2+ transport system protein B
VCFNQNFLVDWRGLCDRVMEGVLYDVLFILVFLVSIATAHVYLQFMEVCGYTGSLAKWSCVL